MKLLIRIAIGVVCLALLYYLIATLTRGFMQH